MIQYANCFFPPVNQQMIATTDCSDSDPVSCSQKKKKKNQLCVTLHLRKMSSDYGTTKCSTNVFILMQKYSKQFHLKTP